VKKKSEIKGISCNVVFYLIYIFFELNRIKTIPYILDANREKELYLLGVLSAKYL